MIELVILLAILAVGGWLAFWMAQDQAADLRKQRDKARAERDSIWALYLDELNRKKAA